MKTKSNKAIFLARFDQSMNEQKVNELYVEYKKKVYSLALSYVKDNYLAEDLSHEILVKCYLTRNKFNGDCSFHSWMYRIAINHCIDFLRKGYRHQGQGTTKRHLSIMWCTFYSIFKSMIDSISLSLQHLTQLLIVIFFFSSFPALQQFKIKKYSRNTFKLFVTSIRNQHGYPSRSHHLQ